MAEISAAAVKSLRDRTGAGMMDCKRALEEAAGDEEKAIDLLRQRGAARAAKRAARETSEGAVVIEGDDEGPVAMVEVTCETDFVARNDEFLEFAGRAARIAADAGVGEGEVREGGDLLDLPEAEALGTELDGLRARIGENVDVGRFVRWVPGAGSVIGRYIHFGNKIGVLVELAGGHEPTAATEMARDVAMHIAATDPAGISPEDIPEEARERERAVLGEQARQEGKPPQIVEKIVEGRMRKFYEQNALLYQAFVKDPDMTIGELLESAPGSLQVVRFVRFEVGV
ncbi:MAG: translation elongation factor Ts [Candidatus Palauibacterales bacterium]|nr:translation elongation factor Ts [Candidatus Palauibacterales bacterium]MDP2530762.1 translation elongation factor Ts [Candidatus Palauibacterales bacterium]MDP2582718.1 translation elongation factor Ts [Candidatus Palauibacterales bacterium]